MTLNLLAASCLLLADCCVYVSPAKFLFPALLGVGFEVLLWTNVVFGISWWFSHRKSWCVVSILAIGLSMGNALTTYSHQFGGQEQESEHSLTVLTYNTHQCSQLKKADKNEVLGYIRESGADIVFLQEYEVRRDPYYLTFDEAKRFLRKEYPYTYYDFSIHNGRRQFGLAIYSKYPLANKNSIHYESRANSSDYCDVIVEGDTIRLFNNHLESNSFTRHELEMPENLSDTEEIKRSTGNILRKMANAYHFRAAEAEMVRDAIAESPYPVIVAGDMNDVPVSYTYHTISKGLNDTFLRQGWGKRGWTFKWKLAGVRIDYIFASDKFTTRSAKVDKTGGSDHYPYVCTLCW